VRIIGIDPGFGILGWAVIESNLKVIDYGTVETSPDMPIDERLFAIHSDISSILERYRPECAVIEKLFFSKNITTAIDVSRATGVILLAFRQHALPYQEVTPMQVKQGITGYGKADKKQMQVMVQRLFNLKEIPKPDDAADALAIALCYSKTPVCKS
jgi:crossover junction endodeoxyribonuclease RuvC